MAVGWYMRFSLSYRDFEELLAERGMSAYSELQEAEFAAEADDTPRSDINVRSVPRISMR